MNLLADRNIPWVQPFFGSFAELSYFDDQPTLPLGQIDGLLVRTTVKIDRQLSPAPRLKFVASPTAGIDHVDLAYLERQQIPFFHSPGNNALAVAQWVISALVLTLGGLRPLVGRKLGIVGFGHVGSRLAQLARSLGMQVRASDPPKQSCGESGPWVSLPELLGWCDVLSLHVPWVNTGAWPTANLINEKEMTRLQDGCVLVNSCRGGVLDQHSLKTQLPRLGPVILDCWEEEPKIDFELADLIAIASPHVAGYSLEAKFRATEQISKQITDMVGLPSINIVSPIPPQTISLNEGTASLFAQVSQIDRLGKQLKRDQNFAQQRNQFTPRHQWESVCLVDCVSIDPQELGLLSRLGFSVPGYP